MYSSALEQLYRTTENDFIQVVKSARMAQMEAPDWPRAIT